MPYPLSLSHFPKWQSVLEGQPAVIGKKQLTAAQEIKAIEAAFDATRDFLYQIEDADDWMTPRELEHYGAGDCEDFAIYRLYKLLEAGITDCELVIGETRPHRIVHCITLARCKNSVSYVLCNMMPAPLEWALYERKFRPIFALSTEGGRFWGDGRQ